MWSDDGLWLARQLGNKNLSGFEDGGVQENLVFIFNVQTICLEVTGLESNSEIS